MKKGIFWLCIVVVILLIVALYTGIFSFLIYLLSIIPILNITIYNWPSVFTFSLCIIIWIIPYELIGFLQDIPGKNKYLIKLFSLISTLLNLSLFTLYILFLDHRFIGLSFSKVGIICLIIITIALSKIINIAGTKLKDAEENNNSI
ncbi:hypothetical protein [Heyndrickxia shackletonii]|uniref:hypothetical protein n=1 Tax=Heyndrickxia shackletonii TaxID=157838 RepID=UPI0006EBEF70|nr:hypothetical protein [Heyndrickxia shackletonii]NEZ00159.1 hypothetical protein [Heyndrickxia shackletonii]